MPHPHPHPPLEGEGLRLPLPIQVPLSVQHYTQDYLESEGSDGSVSLTQTRKAWAAELGLSHEALYRTLKKLQADSIRMRDFPGRAPRVACLEMTTGTEVPAGCLG